MSEQKAKSRIIEQKKESATSNEQQASITSIHQRKNRGAKKSVTLPHIQLPSFTHDTKYPFAFSSLGKRVPYLLSGILGATLLVYILTSVHPDSIANIGLFHSYLIFLVILFSTLWSFLRFFIPFSSIATVTSILVTLLVFLRLQNVEVTLGMVLLSTVLFGTIATISVVVFKK